MKVNWKRTIPLAALALALVGSLFYTLYLMATTPAPQPWQPGDIPGLSISLESPVTVEDLQFATPHRDSYDETWSNNVAASFGQKNGLITGPLLQWKLVNGRLQIYDDTMVWDELTLLSKDSEFITVRSRWGRIERFKILRQPAPAPAAKP